jgi:cytochrome oxidase Cu insertion factor (SCO1/SenC/PrrC family)
MLIVLCCITLVARSTHSLAFQFNPALQPFVPHKKVTKPRYPAPEFTLKDLDGASVSLSDYHGSVVAMMFWTTW